MTDPTQKHYNDFPYEGYAFPQTHPSCLCAIAQLFDLDPPPAPIATARILELGCANGENIIPMAYGLPRATLTGVDLSGRQIGNARRIAAEVGAANLTLHAADIRTIDPSWGEFDYIIAHGVYSWVPEEVRGKLLEICQHQLAPGGVAFISYNVYPGWYEKMVIRRAMRFHAARFNTAGEQIAQARAYLKFLAGSAVKNESSLPALYAGMAQFLDTQSDSYIFHEYLEPHNDPCHFHQFAGNLRDHGLKYLADTDFGCAVPRNLAPETQRTLVQITPDWMAWEQHMDYLIGRTFRQSLIIRAADRAARSPQLEKMHGLYASAGMVPMAPANQAIDPQDPRLFSTEPVEFYEPQWSGANCVLQPKMTTPDPLFKNILLELTERFPLPASMEELTAAVRRRVQGRLPREIAATFTDWRRIAFPLLQAAIFDLVELHSAPPRLVVGVSERPAASAIARWQATHSGAEGSGGRGPQAALTSLRHRPSRARVPWELLHFADGTRTIPEITGAMAAAGAPGAQPAIVAGHLRDLAKNALLVG